MVNQEAAKAMTESMAALTQQLNRVNGQLYRDQGANIIPNFSQEYTLDNLTTRERPIDRIQFDFKSLVLSDGTDTETYINVIFGRANGSKVASKLKNNATYTTDFQVSEITIFSAAQAGKKITVNLFRDAIVSTGSLVNSGVVTVNPSTGLQAIANPIIAAASATLLSAADPTAKVINIQNNDSASIFIGPSNVTNAGATRGLEVVPGGFLQIKTTAAVYCYSVAGGAAGIVTVLKET